MKNLILQHWYGPMQGWANKCKESIQDYASKVNAEYHFLTGYPMGDFFENTNTKPYLVIQKLCMLLEKYDEYDNVLMLDMDMLFTGVVDDIFKYEGIGRLHKVGMKEANASKNGRKWPKLYKQDYPMFFGNCVKLNRNERQILRSKLNKHVISAGVSSDGLPPNDEIIMHYLMHTTDVLNDRNVLELPHDRFCDLPEEAHPDATFLHYCGSRKRLIK
jgi:hypothetical protein